MGIYDDKTNTTVYRVPLNVNEVVLRNAEDDGHTIYINEDLTDEEARKAFDHAVGHIQRNDFDKTDVQQIEAAAHAPAADPTPAPTPVPLLKKRKKKRVFTAFDLELLKQHPEIRNILDIPKDEIPSKPNSRRGLSNEEFKEIHNLIKEQKGERR